MNDNIREIEGTVDPAGLSWELKPASPGEVDGAVAQLTAHMNQRQRAAFRDKLERYARKPDRDLILAVNGGRVLGLICVIDRAKFSFALPDPERERLQEFASVTQLFVHSAVRQRGIGGSLYLRAEQWARDHHRPGIWLVTHRMADWYQRHFGYEEIFRVKVKTAEKIVLAKEFV